MTDREAAGLRGPVQKVLVERVHGDHEYRAELEFDSLGNSAHRGNSLALPEGQDIFWGGLPGLHGYGFPTRGASRIDLRLTGNDTVQEARFLHADGSVATRLVADVDSQGNIVEVKQYSGDKPLLDLCPEELAQIAPEQRERFAALFEAGGLESRIQFRYDKAKRLVSVESFIGAQRINTTTFTYNERGDKASQTQDGQAPALFEYEYDDQGNWVRMVTLLGERRLEERRRITYFS